MERVALADAIAMVRSELTRAIDEGKGDGKKDDSVRFFLREIEIEVTGEFEESSEVKGGVKFWVFTAGASGADSRVSGHRIKVTLGPAGAGGGLLVGRS